MTIGINNSLEAFISVMQFCLKPPNLQPPEGNDTHKGYSEYLMSVIRY